MNYSGVGLEALDAQCEICVTAMAPAPLRGGGSVLVCPACGHVVRRLEQCPADHREQAYGGEANLDRVRLALTYRALTRAGSPRSVFEIGYGSGALLRRFHEDGAAVHGADPDQLRVEVDDVVRAHATLHECGVDALTDLRPDVDLVYGVHVIEHVPDPLRALRIAGDLCRPGGRVAFLTPAADSRGLGLYGAAWWMLEDPTHVRFFSAASLELAARSAGLSDVRVERLVLDSLSVDAASLARAAARGRSPHGVLRRRPVALAGVASAPAVIAARLVAPRLRPTLMLTATAAV